MIASIILTVVIVWYAVATNRMIKNHGENMNKIWRDYFER